MKNRGIPHLHGQARSKSPQGAALPKRGVKVHTIKFGILELSRAKMDNILVVKLVTDGGMHMSPSSKLFKAGQQFDPQKIVIHKKDGRYVDLRSVINLLAFGAAKGDVLVFKFGGKDPQRAKAGIESFIRASYRNFGWFGPTLTFDELAAELA